MAPKRSGIFKNAKDKTKALGKAMKTMKVMKGTTVKAKAKALGKASGKNKASARITSKNLEKLGELTLADKVKQATEASDDPEVQAHLLKESLTGAENSQLHGRHKTMLNKDALAKAEYEQKSKKEKGLCAALWLLQTEGKKYAASKTVVAANEKIKKKDIWESEKSMLQKWSEHEMQLHLTSGRIIWRECQGTPGVFEYKDNQSWERTVNAQRGSIWESGQEGDAKAEDLEKFSTLYNEEAMALPNTGFLSSMGKGQKGLGKGKGKGKPHLLMLKDKDPDYENEEEDPEPTPEQKLEAATKQVRKARDLVQKTHADLEETSGWHPWKRCWAS